jgi:hypothetical protein
MAEDLNPNLQKPFSELTDKEQLQEEFEWAAGQPAREEKSGEHIDPHKPGN